MQPDPTFEQRIAEMSPAMSSVPRRASAQSSSLHVRPRYPRRTEDALIEAISRIPTHPQQPRRPSQPAPPEPLPGMWQYQSPEFKAESSLSSLSLITPHRAARVAQPPSPATSGASWSIADLDTAPTPMLSENPTNLAAIEQDLVPWTTGSGANSPYARRIAEPGDSRPLKRTVTLYPWDSLRWWLLYPGRFEFLLWLGSALLLLCLTVIFLFLGILNLFFCR